MVNSGAWTWDKAVKKNVLITVAFASTLTISNFVISLNNSVAAVTAAVGADASDLETARAVSIRMLQQQLRAGDENDERPKDLLQLAGLGKILGYVVDRKNEDLIIFGYAGKDLPALHLEDFVVALRNTWLKYSPLRGNTYVYSYPGCSIDPDPVTVQKLQRIGQKVASSSSFVQVEEDLKSWRQTCEEQQSVRVIGIPFHTHFAQVLVKADYDMKSIVDGSDSLDIPGLVSLTDMKLAQARYALLQNKQISISLANLNRFWFCPAKNVYEEEEDIVFIKQCRIQLLTEEMFVSAKGQLASAQKVSTDARQFAQSFSGLFNTISEERPVYRELENLFRFFALAKLIKFSSANEKASVDLAYFLEDFPISQGHVSESLPGRSAIREFQHRTDFQGGYSISQLWLPSCGGVAIEIEPKSEDFVHTSKGLLYRLKEKILDRRKSPTDLYWDLGKESADVLEETKLSQYASNINHSGKNFSALIVAYKGDEYRVYRGTGDLFCRDKHQKKVIQTIVSRMGKDLKDAVYLFMTGFPSKDKIRAFETSARINLSTIRSGVEVRAAKCGDQMPGSEMGLLWPGIRLDKALAVANGTEIYKTGNHFEFRLPFVTKMKGRLRNLTLCSKSKTRAVLERVLHKALSYFLIVPDNESNLLDFLIQIRHELKKDHGLEDEKVDSLIIDELTGLEISVLPVAKNRRAA